MDTTKPKKSAEQLAQESAIKILKSGIAIGKSDAKSESKDPRRKKLARNIDTIAKAREKGKEATFKQIKSAFSALDDDRENYAKAKSLFEKAGMYFDQIDVPVKAKPQPQSS